MELKPAAPHTVDVEASVPEVSSSFLLSTGAFYTHVSPWQRHDLQCPEVIGSGRPRSRWNIQHATGDDEVANFFSSDTSDLVVGEITYYQDDDGQTAGTDKLVTMSVANATPNSVSSRQDRLSFGNVATAETSLKPSVPVNPRIPAFGNIFKKSSADFIGGIPPEELSGDENREPDFYQEDYVKKYDEGAQERAEHLRSSRQNGKYQESPYFYFDVAKTSCPVKKLPVHFLDEDVAMVDVDTLPSSMNSLELSPRVSKKENAGNRFHLDQSKWASSS